MYHSTLTFSICLLTAALTGCSFGADLGGYTATDSGNDGAQTDSPDLADTADPPDAAPDADTRDAPDIADTHDAPDLIDVPDPPDAPDVADVADGGDLPDSPDTSDAPDLPPDCASICASVLGAIITGCEPVCTYACESPWVDVNGDLDDGERGNGCECRQVGETDLCSDDIDNDCNGIVNDGCCDENGWVTIAGSTNPLSRPAVAFHIDGAVLVAWEESTETGPVVRAAIQGPRFQRVPLVPVAPEHGARYPSATVAGDQFVLTWINGQEVPDRKTLMTRSYTLNGQPGGTREFGATTSDVRLTQANVINARPGVLAAFWVERGCTDLEDDTQCVQLAIQGMDARLLDDADPAARLGRGRLAVSEAGTSIATVWVEEEETRSLKYAISATATLTELGDGQFETQPDSVPSSPDVMAWLGDSYVTTWFDADSEALAVQQLGAEGLRTPFGGDTARDPRLAHNGARMDFSVIWRDSGRLIQTTVSDLLVVSSNVHLLWPTVEVESHAVASSGTGRFAVAAVLSDRVVLGIFDPDGVATCP